MNLKRVCKICKVDLLSKSTYDSHLSSKKHSIKLSKLKTLPSIEEYIITIKGRSHDEINSSNIYFDEKEKDEMNKILILFKKKKIILLKDEIIGQLLYIDELNLKKDDLNLKIGFNNLNNLLFKEKTIKNKKKNKNKKVISKEERVHSIRNHNGLGILVKICIVLLKDPLMDVTILNSSLSIMVKILETNLNMNYLILTNQSLELVEMFMLSTSINTYLFKYISLLFKNNNITTFKILLEEIWKYMITVDINTIDRIISSINSSSSSNELNCFIDYFLYSSDFILTSNLMNTKGINSLVSVKILCPLITLFLPLSSSSTKNETLNFVKLLINLSKLNLLEFQFHLLKSRKICYELFNLLFSNNVNNIDFNINNNELLYNLLYLFGNYLLENNSNQEILLWNSNNLLEKLCNLPFEYYFISKYKNILIPTILCSCYNNIKNYNILCKQLNPSILYDFLNTKLEEDSYNNDTFPKSLYIPALKFFKK